MLEARTISITVSHPWQALYEAIWQPGFFPRWASGLSNSALEKQGDHWLAEGPEGAIRIRFTGYNRFGVMDHHVDPGNGQEIYVPLRVIPNEGGAEVLLTLFWQPGMSDAKFLADAAWVERDLKVLQSLFAG
jgi:hypothetical protein